MSTFLYAGFVHLALGWALGMPFLFYLERLYGTPRCLFIFVTAGWAGQLWSALFGPTLIGVGGSTAMAGIIGAYWAHLLLTYEVQRWREVQLGLLLSFTAYALLLVFGIFPFVNNWGHLAGMAIGLVLGLPTLAGRVRDEQGRRVWKWPLVLPALCVFVTAIVTVGYYFYSEDRPFSWCPDCHWVECVRPTAAQQKRGSLGWHHLLRPRSRLTDSPSPSPLRLVCRSIPTAGTAVLPPFLPSASKSRSVPTTPATLSSHRAGADARPRLVPYTPTSPHCTERVPRVPVLYGVVYG